MPPGKSKPKDDTWTTHELNQALKGAHGNQERKRRSRNDDDDRGLRHNDEGDESRRKHKDGSKRSHKREDDGGKDKSRSNRDVSPEPLVGLTEEDRERLRQERRERRGGKTEKKEEKPRHKEEKPVDNNEDVTRHHHRDEEEHRRRKETNDERYAKGDRGQAKDKEDRESKPEADKERRNEKGHRERKHEERDKERRHEERNKEQRREKSDRERRYEDADREKRHKEREREWRHKKDDSEWKSERENTEQRREKDGRERHLKRDSGEHDFNSNEREQRQEREDKTQRRHKSGKESEHREVDEDEYERRHHEKREKREKQNRQNEELAKRENQHRERGDDRDHGRYQQAKDVRNGEDKTRDREREERHRRREKEKEEQHKDRKERQKDPDERTKEQENYHRSRDSERDKQSLREQDEEQQKAKYQKKQREREEMIVQTKADDSYNEYEDDFEDYEEDFEEENQDIQQDSDNEEDYQDGQDYNRNRMPEKTHPKSFINFVSAKQRVMNKSAASRARHRAEDLRNMIELDTVYYDMFDLPPVKEYELYIRSFGRSNTKQAYVQTNEDAVERDVQTEKADDLNKWTQHPADDIDACGGEGLLVKESTSHTKANNNLETIALGHFLEKSAQIFSTLLDEERGLGELSDCTVDRSNLSISEGVTQLASLPFLAGRYVKQACFCLLQPHMFLTVYSRPREVSGENPLANCGLICVWSTKEMAYPQRILTSVSEPTCACFSPIRASLVIAGLVDGSVCVWDLRESSSLHRTVFLQDQDVCIRFPTYNTAGVSEKENHHSPVVAMTAVHPTVLRKEVEESSFENTQGLSFQLASVEENAVINLWVVTEIPLPDMAGSGIDLGLAPGGRIKLVHTSSIKLESPNKNVQAGNSRAWDVKLNPSDLNHFFVATDLGQVIHGVRFGSRVYPRVFQPVADFPSCVTCIDFSPFGEPYFLAGCEDGTVHLYHTSSEHPLTSWSTFSIGHSIVSIQWSQSRPAVFFVLNANSVVFVFDLVETGLSPVRTDQVSSDRVTFMAVASDPVITGIGKSQPAHILLCLGNGVTELHSVCAGLRQQQPLEKEFLAHYLERF